MRRSLFFPDNTVLINYAHMDELDLLERLLNGRGSWTITLSQEVADSARIPGLSSLQNVGSFLGSPIAPSPTERIHTLDIRKTFAAPGDPKKKHLGEAETFAVIQARDSRHFIVTDDGDAYRYATSHEIPVQTTCDLLALAVKVGFIEFDVAWLKLEALFSMPRYITQAPRSRHLFEVLCSPRRAA
jgi:predicted nucleic acid-binding protein